MILSCLSKTCGEWIKEDNNDRMQSYVVNSTDSFFNHVMTIAVCKISLKCSKVDDRKKTRS